MDDLAGAEVSSLVENAFQDLGKIFNKIGIWESKTKAFMVSLDILLNTSTMLLEITPDQMKEILDLKELW